MIHLTGMVEINAGFKEVTMTEAGRRQVFEQIRAKELARGAHEDEAARIAAESVDKVMATLGATSPASSATPQNSPSA